MNLRRSIVALFAFVSVVTSAQHQPNTLLIVGSYTNDIAAKGIHIFRFNTSTGKLSKLSTSEPIINPSYLAISPNGKYLYACTDTKMPQKGSISAFSINSDEGSIRFINKVTSGGDNPVYIAIDKFNRFVITGNYSSGTVTLAPIKANGGLSHKTETIAFRDSSINKSRQSESHIHSTFFDPSFSYIFAPDLGADKIRAFSFRSNKAPHLITRADLDVKTTPGSGPRHFAFHPNGRFGYLIEELSGSISAYSYANGELLPFQRIQSYASIMESYGTADIHISPDGRFLYSSNRFIGENSIGIFSIDSISGKLSLVGHQFTGGDHPRNFTIDPSGNFLLVANMLTNNIVIFRRDLQTGLLTKVGEEKSVTRPSCLQMRSY